MIVNKIGTKEINKMEYVTENHCIYNSVGTKLDLEYKREFIYTLNDYVIHNLSSISKVGNKLIVNEIDRDTLNVIKYIRTINLVMGGDPLDNLGRNVLSIISNYFRRNVMLYNEEERTFYYFKQYDTATVKLFKIINYNELMIILNKKERKREQARSVTAMKFKDLKMPLDEKLIQQRTLDKDLYLIEMDIQDEILQEYFPGTRVHARVHDFINNYAPFIRIYINKESVGMWHEIYHNVKYNYLLQHEKDAILYNHIYNPNVQLTGDGIKLLELAMVRVDRKRLFNRKNVMYKMNNSAYKYISGTWRNRILERKMNVLLEDKDFYDDVIINQKIKICLTNKKKNTTGMLTNGIRPVINVKTGKGYITYSKLIGKIYIMIGNNNNDVSDELGSEIVIYQVKNSNTIFGSEDEIYYHFYVYYNNPQTMPYELQNGVNIIIFNSNSKRSYYTHNGINSNIEMMMHTGLKSKIMNIIKEYLCKTHYVDNYGITNMTVYEELMRRNRIGELKWEIKYVEIILNLPEFISIITPGYMLNNLNMFNRNNTFKFDCMQIDYNTDNLNTIKRVSITDFLLPCGMIVDYATGFLNYHRCISYLYQVDEDEYGYECKCGRKYRYPELKKTCKEMICINDLTENNGITSNINRYRKVKDNDKYYLTDFNCLDMF